MKILEFLACLSWLLLPAFAIRPFAPLPSQSLDHPERIMEQRGQLDCLGHNFQDLDIFRRHEAALISYPEVRVGCETISVKPFRPSSQPPEPEDRWAWTRNNNKEVPPRNAMELEDKAVKYFVIDMYGNETAVGPGSEVTVETYDLSQVYVYKNGPVVSDLSTRLETFTFEQLCFPSVCYRPGEKKPEACRNYMEMFLLEGGSTFLVDCADLPSAQCDFRIGHTAYDRRRFKGKSLATFSSNITTYCSLETNDGPLLGPLRTPNYPSLPELLSSSSSLRTEVNSDNYVYVNESQQCSLRTSALFSKHYRADKYTDKTLVTSCLVTVPLGAPFSTTFAVDFFVAENFFADEKQIRPGQQVALTGYRARECADEKYFGATSLRTRKVPLQVKFEDLCFPAECFEELPPLDDAKCELRYPKGLPPTGTTFGYMNPATGIKNLWTFPQ